MQRSANCTMSIGLRRGTKRSGGPQYRAGADAQCDAAAASIRTLDVRATEQSCISTVSYHAVDRKAKGSGGFGRVILFEILFALAMEVI